MNKFKTITISMIVMLMMVACTTRFLPVPSPYIEIVDDIAILRYNSTVLNARAMTWVADPTDLADYFSTIHVRIHNRGNEVIRLSPADFVLIDENGLQHDAFLSDFVLNVMNLQNIRHDRLDDGTNEIGESRREAMERRNRGRMNVITRSFDFGDLHPNAVKEGVIFFHRLETRTQEFRLLHKSHEIVFARQ
jgi:c-di-AMP phosphodiesterase-like protein